MIALLDYSVSTLYGRRCFIALKYQAHPCVNKLHGSSSSVYTDVLNPGSLNCSPAVRIFDGAQTPRLTPSQSQLGECEVNRLSLGIPTYIVHSSARHGVQIRTPCASKQCQSMAKLIRSAAAAIPGVCGTAKRKSQCRMLGLQSISKHCRMLKSSSTATQNITTPRYRSSSMRSMRSS